MSRGIAGALTLVVLTAAACSEPASPPVPQTVAVTAAASGGVATSGGTGGGSGGGGGAIGGGSGGGGGGGGGGSARPCAILSISILNDVLNGLTVPSFWQPNMGYVAQVSGTAEKSCDLVANATITFEDLSNVGDGCELSLSPWVNNPAYLNPKYGAKPMSRYLETFIYYTGTNCLGHSRTLKATLTDPSPGGKTTSVTMNWTP